MRKIDKKDLQILAELQTDGKMRMRELARRLGLPATTVYNRIRKLEQEKVIKHYTIAIDYEKVDRPLEAFILIVASPRTADNRRVDQNDLARRVAKVAGIEKVAVITGTHDLVALVRARDMHDLGRIITDQVRQIDGVERTETKMVVEAFMPGKAPALA